MPPSATPKTPVKSKLSPVKLDPPQSSLVTPTKPDKVVIKTRNNVLETTSSNAQLASKFDAMSLASPGSSPTKRVYHAPAASSPPKENRGPRQQQQSQQSQQTGDKLQITLRPPPEDDSMSPPGMSEHAKKSLRSINALRGLSLDEIEIINKSNIKRLATVTQLCLIPSPPLFSSFMSETDVVCVCRLH